METRLNAEGSKPATWRDAWPGAVGGAIGVFAVLAPIAPLATAVTGAAAAAAVGAVLIYALGKIGDSPTATE